MANFDHSYARPLSHDHSYAMRESVYPAGAGSTQERTVAGSGNFITVILSIAH